MKINLIGILLLGSIVFTGISSCTNNTEKSKAPEGKDSLQAYVAERLPIYAKVRLSTDIQKLTDKSQQKHISFDAFFANVIFEQGISVLGLK